MGVLTALFNGFAGGTFAGGLSLSLRRILGGYAISLVAGTALGLALGRIKPLDETVGSLVLGLQTLPSICWLPLAVLWFGLSEASIGFVVIMGAVLSITISTRSGVRNVPPLLLRASKTLGARGWRVYTDVVLPAAFPEIISGMKLGWSFAWRSLMAGELLFVSLGLGHLLQIGRELNDMNQVVAVMAVIIAVGLVMDLLVFANLEKKVRLKWGLAAA